MTPEALADLHAAAFAAPRPWSAAEFAALLADPATFHVSEPGGFLLARTAAGEAELLTVAVDPARRRQGIGTALVAAFLERSAAAGAAEAFLEVGADNEAARSLYAAAGFTQAGLRRAYYRDAGGAPVDALVLRRALPHPEAPARFLPPRPRLPPR